MMISKNRIIFFAILILAACILCWILDRVRASYTAFYTPELTEVTVLNSDQIGRIENEFGFSLPEESDIIHCSLENGKDNMFTVTISGISSIDNFLNDNIRIELHGSYENYEKLDYSGNPVNTTWYYGFYNHSKRNIFIYVIGSDTVVELQKSGIVDNALADMFKLDD